MKPDSDLSTAINATQRARRLSWVAISLAALSLLVGAIGSLVGGSQHWWLWAGPLLVIANVCTGTFGALRRWRYLEKAYPYVSIALAIGMINAILLSMGWPRGTA